MRRRFIITTSVAIIMFAICLFGINVYASMQQSFSLSSRIGFKTNPDVCLGISCEVSDCKQANYTSPPSGSGYNDINKWREAVGIVHTEKFTEADRGSQTLTGWQITEPLEFVSYDTAIVYKIVIKNYSLMKVSVKLSILDEQDKDTGIKPSDFINNTAYVGNTPITEDGFTLGAYVPATSTTSEIYSEATILLKTMVKDPSRSFTVENNFTLTIETIG